MKDYEKVFAVGYDWLREYRALSGTARRVLDLYVEQADEQGIAHFSRAGTMRAMGLASMTIERAVRQLIQEGFILQAGYSRMAVNLDRVWIGQRDRAEKALLLRKFDQHKKGFAHTLAKKQAAGRESWRKRQGVKDGVVEENSEGDDSPG